MAFLSDMLKSDMLREQHKEASFCCSCNKKITNGGMWAMSKNNLGICKECAPVLLDWYIDSLLDTDVINESDDVENMKKLSNDISVRYKRKIDKKLNYGRDHM